MVLVLPLIGRRLMLKTGRHKPAWPLPLIVTLRRIVLVAVASTPLLLSQAHAAPLSAIMIMSLRSVAVVPQMAPPDLLARAKSVPKCAGRPTVRLTDKERRERIARNPDDPSISADAVRRNLEATPSHPCSKAIGETNSK